MARCATCGTALEDAAQEFCGGDRCLRVFMRRAAPLGSIGYTGSYRERAGDADVSVVSVLEARGPE
jgi:hypothetical protein